MSDNVDLFNFSKQKNEMKSSTNSNFKFLDNSSLLNKRETFLNVKEEHSQIEKPNESFFMNKLSNTQPEMQISFPPNGYSSSQDPFKTHRKESQNEKMFYPSQDTINKKAEISFSRNDYLDQSKDIMSIF